MGCDIHTKILLYSKVEKKYVDSHEIQDMGNYTFPEIFEGRNYDIFAILSNVRGSRFNLGTDEMGDPPVSKTFKKAVMEDRDYHSWTWYYVEKLMNDLKNLHTWMTKLQTKYKVITKTYPKNWYKHWTDEKWKITDPIYNSERYDDEDMEMMWYDEDDKYLIDNVKDMIKKCSLILHVQDPFDPHYGDPNYDYNKSYREYLSKYIDLKKTIVLFYYDS